MRKARQLSTIIAASLVVMSFAHAASGELKTAVVQSGSAAGTTGFDGVVEAVRQTVMAAQVPGAVIALGVKAGDQVREGQMLAHIDARAATQNTMASQAQVQAARSALDVATKEYERQKQLYQKQYISQAALERAEAQYNATSAQLKAQLAQAGAAHVQSDFYTVKAPYAGVVADVPVALGDMAMPGKPLVTMYDPSALRVTASVPQTVLAHMTANKPVKVELLGLPAENQWLTRPTLQVLPTIDAATHSAEVRVDLPAGLKGVSPGMFARVWLTTEEAGGARLFVPASAIVRRAEMTGLYVVDANGRTVLRQVRLGRTQDDTVEVLSGVAAGEHVAVDPQAAARVAR